MNQLIEQIKAEVEKKAKAFGESTEWNENETPEGDFIIGANSLIPIIDFIIDEHLGLVLEHYSEENSEQAEEQFKSKILSFLKGKL